MKTLKQRMLLLAAMIASMLLLAGCSAGSTINTTFRLNGDMSGSREMSIVINEAVFEDYFQGTTQDLKNTIEASCPPQMRWSFTEGQDMELLFVIDFSSVLDYQQKVAELMGTEGEAQIIASDTLWSSGIYAEENFTSEDLLAWLKNALIDNGLVSESNAGMIFNLGDTEFYYQGERMPCSYDRIYVDEVEYVAIDRIDFLTDINDLNDYDKKIIFSIPTDSFNKKTSEIEAYFKDVVPEGASYDKSVSDSNTVFTIAKQHMTLEDMENFALSVFGNGNASVKEQYPDVEGSPFVFSQYFEEDLNVVNFVTGAQDGTSFGYYVKPAADYTVYDAEDVNSPLACTYDDGRYPGYYCLSDSDRRGLEKNYSVLVQKEIYKVTSIDVATSRNPLTSKWNRTSTFTFARVPDKEEQEVLVQRVEERLYIESEAPDDVFAENTEAEPEKPQKLKGVTIKAKDKDVFQITIKQKGTREEILQSTEALFGQPGELLYAAESGFAKVRRQEAFAETIDYSGILGTIPDNFAIHYQMTPGLFASVEYYNRGMTEGTITNGKFMVDLSSPYVNIEYSGKAINPVAIGFWVMLAAAVICVFIALIKAGIFRKKEESMPVMAEAISQPVMSEPAAVSEPESMTEPAAVSEPEPADPEPVRHIARFCENCGSARTPGAIFCEKCGTKFEDA